MTDARLGSHVEPGPLTDEEKQEFFARPIIARLATIRPDGAPHIVPLWFHWDGEDFYLVARKRSSFVENITRNPKVCLSIAADDVPYTRATIIGRANVENPEGNPEPWLPLLYEMTERYVGDVDDGYADRTAKFRRWLIRIEVDELISWRGGGWAKSYTREEAPK